MQPMDYEKLPFKCKGFHEYVHFPSIVKTIFLPHLILWKINRNRNKSRVPLQLRIYLHEILLNQLVNILLSQTQIVMLLYPYSSSGIISPRCFVIFWPFAYLDFFHIKGVKDLIFGRGPYFMGDQGMYLNRWYLYFELAIDITLEGPMWVFLPITFAFME
jgi:hypothetical protein